ncbi:L,D-transpeptidase catalytic domain [Clostridium cavendishii DSM 21758]|uniref:L,D-transpeptidase catalytic domain n=1 Tax=Clostridium cavendishii DSM 21758 TaxID=1121302 RepID=A0A1M6SSM6_9CLOT|nr:L,D-transpeptidase [Clostridium cavendishii]SHK47647.1 L,D-transpeptidase catalytic domain [Clostridium cavendishii DSM 21758]
MFKNFKVKKKLIVSISVAILLVLSYLCFCITSYNKLLANFKNNFDNGDFVKANSILLNYKHFNLLKDFKLNKDLNIYFSNHIDNLNKELQEKNISEEFLISTLCEMDRYEVSIDKIKKTENSLPLFSKSKTNFEKGIQYFNDKKYTDALSSFNDVSQAYIDYNKSLDYAKKCTTFIKEDVLAEASSLADDKYYSKAITLIQDKLNLLKSDEDLKAKLSEYEEKKKEYLTASNQKAANDAKATAASLTVLTKDNINKFDLESNTKYLIFTNIATQKTYVFTGSKNKWNLAREFLCSTGIKGQDTPKGSFSVKNKGDWFFNEAISEGAKYWVGFMDNYLYHSYPMNKDQKITDKTLGKAASHGCIRLKTEDSKWLHDNIPMDTKVIIN